MSEFKMIASFRTIDDLRALTGYNSQGYLQQAADMICRNPSINRLEVQEALKAANRQSAEIHLTQLDPTALVGCKGALGARIALIREQFIAGGIECDSNKRLIGPDGERIEAALERATGKRVVAFSGTKRPVGTQP